MLPHIKYFHISGRGHQRPRRRLPAQVSTLFHIGKNPATNRQRRSPMTRCPAGCHLLPHLAVPGHYERPTNWQLRHGRESWIRRSDQHHPQSTARRVAGHAATLVAGRYCTGTQRVRSSTQTTQRYSTPQTRITLPHCMIHRPSIAPTICKHPQPQVQNPSSVSSSPTGGTKPQVRAVYASALKAAKCWVRRGYAGTFRSAHLARIERLRLLPPSSNVAGPMASRLDRNSVPAQRI